MDAAATDYSAAVNVLKNNGCDVVIACMNQVPLATLMASMRDADYNADVITSYVNASAVTLGRLRRERLRHCRAQGLLHRLAPTPAPRPA